MEKDTNKTRVRFVFLDDSLIALFPDEVADDKGNISSYQHIGQHSAASPELMDNTKADALDYDALATELEGLGYNLEVI